MNELLRFKMRDMRSYALDEQQKYFGYLSKGGNRLAKVPPNFTQERAPNMSQFVTTLSAGAMATVLVCGTAFMATPATATPGADKAALKQATAICKAQVKEQAHFEEMSLYARHKLVKKCVKDTPAGH